MSPTYIAPVTSLLSTLRLDTLNDIEVFTESLSLFSQYKTNSKTPTLSKLESCAVEIDR